LPGGTRCMEAIHTLELLAPVTLTLLRPLARLAAPRRLTSLSSLTRSRASGTKASDAEGHPVDQAQLVLHGCAPANTLCVAQEWQAPHRTAVTGLRRYGHTACGQACRATHDARWRLPAWRNDARAWSSTPQAQRRHLQPEIHPHSHHAAPNGSASARGCRRVGGAAGCAAPGWRTGCRSWLPPPSRRQRWSAWAPRWPSRSSRPDARCTPWRGLRARARGLTAACARRIHGLTREG